MIPNALKAFLAKRIRSGRSIQFKKSNEFERLTYVKEQSELTSDGDQLKPSEPQKERRNSREVCQLI
jgi:hypothetical protein